MCFLETKNLMTDTVTKISHLDQDETGLYSGVSEVKEEVKHMNYIKHDSDDGPSPMHS